MSGNFDRLREIFLATLEQASDRRDAYLDQVCAGDEELRRNLDVMLKAHTGEGPLDRALLQDGQTTAYEQPSELSGTVIGPYKLLEPIGEGGMGTVWMSQQSEPVKRVVALKLIKAGMDSKQVIARFEAERQALALMDHPNIAKVLDGGMSEGRPYFVMELVKGVPITRYCDEHHLTPRQRLEIFVPVCQAVQHAHQKGIIHRDLKPSNVLVAQYDGRPVPKVIDFGVAKAAGQSLTDKTLVTGFGDIIGTLEYMSPEQAEINQLDIDTRSDIYSLGVLLYELLAGSPPFSKKDLEKVGMLEMLRVIREDEPSRPSTKLSSSVALPSLSASRGTEPAKLTKIVRGELDWIVMKALEKDRNRRYETANGFAMDVQRYLADEAVQACPPSTGYRLRKFARRNKRALAIAGVLVASALVMVGSLGWAVRDRRAREQELAHETTRQLGLTEDEIHRALDQANTYRDELHAVLRRKGGVQHLLNLPARWDYLIKSAQTELSHAQALWARTEGNVDPELTRSLGHLKDQLIADEADRRLALRLETIRMDRAIDKADKPTTTQEHDDAFSRAFAEAGLPVLESDPAALTGRFCSSPIKEQLVAALDDWADVRFVLRKDEASANKLLALSRATALDDGWGDRFRDVRLWSDKKALVKLATARPPTGLSPQLQDLVGRQLPPDSIERDAWFRQAQSEHPTDFWLSFDLARGFIKENPAEAVALLRVALALRPGNWVVYDNLFNALYRQWKLPEALAALEKSNELEPNPSLYYTHLGLVLRSQKKPREAVAACRKAVEFGPTVASLHNNLGVALVSQGEFTEAIAAYHRAIELDPKIAAAHGNLGFVFDKQKKPVEAVAAYRKAIELAPENATNYYNLALVVLHHDPVEAMALCHKAIELEPKVCQGHHGLGLALEQQEKLTEAIAAYRKAVELNPKNASAHISLGLALDKKKLPEAVAVCRKAVAIDPERAKAYQALSVALFNQQRFPEALAACRKAIELDQTDAEAYSILGDVVADVSKAVDAYRKAIELDPKLVPAYCGLGRALVRDNKLSEAVDACEQALKLDPKNAIAYTHLGTALRAQAKVSEAVAAHRKAVELNPTGAWHWYYLGFALRAQAKLTEAVAAHRKAVELNPTDARLWHGLGLALEIQNPLEAIATHQKVIELDPTNAFGHTHLGLVLAKDKRFSEAIAAFTRAINLDPKMLAAHHGLGSALRTLGKFDGAVAAFREAIRLVPDSHQSHYGLVVTLSEHGKPKEALAAAKDGCRSNADNASVLASIGAALVKIGRPDEAIPVREKTVAVQTSRFGPDHGDTLLSIRELANTHAADGRHADAAKVVGGFVGKKSASWRDCQQAANVLSRCVALAAKDDKLPQVDRSSVIRKYFEQAKQLLVQAGHQMSGKTEAQNAVGVEYDHIAWELHKSGLLGEAKEAYLLGNSILENLLASAPGTKNHRFSLARNCHNLSNLLRQMADSTLSETEKVHRRTCELWGKLAADYLEDPEYRNQLAFANGNLGLLLQFDGRRQEAEQAFEQGLVVAEKLVADFSDSDKYFRTFAGFVNDFARFLRESGSLAKARRLLERVIAQHKRRLAGKPADESLQQVVFDWHIGLAETLTQLQDHRALAKVATDLWLYPGLPRNTCNGACWLARCAQLAKKDATIPDSERSVLAQRYTVGAIDLLREAIYRGYANVDQLKKDSDLDSLRGENDFKLILGELEAKLKKK